MTTATRKDQDDAEVKAGGRRPPIDPRIRARRVEVKRSAGRRRLRWVIAFAAVLAVALMGVGVAFSPLLDVDRLIVSGQLRTAPEDVVAASGIAKGDALVRLDLPAAERRVEALPWVAEATVTRRWPGSVRYRILEREPVGVLEAADGRWFAADGAGRVLATLDSVSGGFPVIEGTGTEARVGAESPAEDRGPFRVAAVIPAATRPLVEAVVLGADQSVTIRLVAGGTVTVGAIDDLRQKGIALASVLAAVDPCVATLDLSIASAPVLTRSPGCG